MGFTKYTHRTTLYSILITMALALLPITGAAAPQHTDITKPTRERVKKNDSKTTDKKDSKKEDKKDSKKEDKKDSKKEDKKADAKPAAPKKEEPKPAVTPKKEEPKPAAENPKKEEQAKPAANDTTAKADAPSKPKPPTYPDKVQFDGIDISKHQGNINWEELKKNTKIKFVYIKATEGTDYVDPKYQENIRNARKHGFKVGSYHFLSTRSAVTTQFYNFVRTAKREDQDLLPVIDVERLKPWTPQQLRDSLKVFADLVEDYYGCKPMIYASEKFFTSNLGRAFSQYPLFIAKYSPNQPSVGYKWVLWQFAENGLFKAVKGNGGLVDMSRFGNGYGINDIAYVPSKHKPKNASIKEIVDHKEKPEKVNMTTEQKPKEAPKPSKKQQEEAKKQAEKEKRTKERNKKLAEEEAKKKAEAQKKEQQKAEQLKREKAKQQAREAAAKKEAEEKAKRKAEAQKARQQKAERDAKNKSNKSNKSANLINSSSSKLTQSQRNDSIRNAQLKGRKTNKSSADND